MIQNFSAYYRKKHHIKRLVNKGQVLKGILTSRKYKSLISDSLSHMSDLFFARPIVVVGVGGLLGGSLGFSFSYPDALGVFIMIVAFAALIIIRIFTNSPILNIRLVLLLLSFVLGLYCMSLICLSRNRAEGALNKEQIAGLELKEDNGYSAKNAVSKAVSEYEGYIVSVSLSDEGYKSFTLLWKDKILVHFASSRKDLSFGKHVRISGVMSEVPSARNPGGFDQKSYYGRQGIFLSIETYDDNIFLLNDKALATDIFVKLEMSGLALRRDIGSMWSKVLSADDAALLSGMILGDTSGMSTELKSAFRMCNMAHLTAVSGANVAYFLVPLSVFFQKMSPRRTVRQIFIFVFLVFFGFLTGWTASVTRALFMSFGGLISARLMKRPDPVSAIFLTSVILMINNPFVTVDLGFLLSFSATLSLILFSSQMETCILSFPAKFKRHQPEEMHHPNTKDHQKVKYPWIREIGSVFVKASACLICTQLGMLPWLIILSGKESVLLFFTNLIGSFLTEGISLISLPLSGGLLLAQIFPFFLPIIKIMFIPLGGLLFFLSQMAIQCSGQTVQALRLSSVEPLLLFSGCFFVLTYIIPKGFLSRNLRRGMVFLLVAGTGVQINTYMNRPEAIVIFTDVGQGDSALIMLDNGISVLIDGGDVGSGKNILIPMMNYYGIKEPDITILTHLHSDHGSGIIELIEAGRVSSVYTPCVSEGKELGGLFSLSKDKRVVLHSIRKDDKMILSKTTELYILSPQNITENGGNEDSAVILLCVSGTGILFMGDAGESTESMLLSRKETTALLQNNADFLKVGHHGSKFSTTQRFLASLSLRAAIISVGDNNFGHPTPDTLNRLADEDIDVYRTDYTGADLLYIWPKSAKISTYVKAAS